MEKSEINQMDDKNTLNNKKRIAIIGRWMPIHNGHKNFLINFAKDKDVEKIIIMIGSCYQRHGLRFCITATEREKMIRAIMNRENIPEEKYEIIPVPDYPTFDEWFSDILEICNKNKITHFCTGNYEDILDILSKEKINLNMKLINPEVNSNFHYHATNIRNMIIDGQYESLKNLIPDEIRPILFKYSFKEILSSSKKSESDFIEEKQSVTIILLVKNILDGKVYTLLGNRQLSEKEYPGMFSFPCGNIKKFETVINACIRNFYEKTGIKIDIIDNSLEPALIKFTDLNSNHIEQMYINGIYDSINTSTNKTYYSSSQCFTIFIENNLEEIQNLIAPKQDLENVHFCDIQKVIKEPLAYEHKKMLKKSIEIYNSEPNLYN